MWSLLKWEIPERAKKRFLNATSRVPIARFFCRFLSRFWRGMEWIYVLQIIVKFSRARFHLNGVSLSKSIASSTVAIIVSIDAFQPLHLFHYLHCILLNQSLVGEDILLLSAAVQVCARQDVRNSPESGGKNVWFTSIPDHGVCIPVEQHGNELDDDDGEEEEHEDNSNWLKMQILFGDNDLGKRKLLELKLCMKFLFIGSLCYISCWSVGCQMPFSTNVMHRLAQHESLLPIMYLCARHRGAFIPKLCIQQAVQHRLGWIFFGSQDQV